MAADSASVRTILSKRAKRTDAAIAQKPPDRGELSLPNTWVLARVALIPASLRHDMISEAAYFRAAARGFAPGHEFEDWLAAELEIDEVISARYRY
jgi:DUF2934 family protein